jgi:MFS transporter, DHA1 family, tetracycline resistance protein
MMALWGLAGPASLEMMSRLVSPSEQGQLQGANSSSRSVTGLLAPGVFTGIFAWLLSALPGAPFFLAALPLLAAAGVSWVVTKPSPAFARTG